MENIVEVVSNSLGNIVSNLVGNVSPDILLIGIPLFGLSILIGKAKDFFKLSADIKEKKRKNYWRWYYANKKKSK